MRPRRALLSGLLAALLSAAPVFAAVEWTLIAAPARHSVLQVMFDILRHRPAVLVAFQGDARDAQPALHVWNGEEWAPISLRDLAEVRFVQTVPARVVLIGDETVLPPAIAESTAWCPRTAAVTSLDTASLVNELGHLFQFSRAEWAWFAARYKLTLKDRSAEAGPSWYDRRENAPPPPRLPLFRRHRAVGPSRPAQPESVGAPASPEPAATPAPMPTEPPAPEPAEIRPAPEASTLPATPTPPAADATPGPATGGQSGANAAAAMPPAATDDDTKGIK